MIVRRYRSTDRNVWEEVNTAAKNGHFFFGRGYVEYHGSRIQDHSLLVVEDCKVLCVMPGNVSGSTYWSHQGLTFGGLISTEAVGSVRMLDILSCVLEYLRSCNFSALSYKSMPSIYHRRPSNEDIYALHRVGAAVTRRDLSTVVDFSDPGQISARRRRGVKKAMKGGVCTKEIYDPEIFWPVLINNLQERHGVSPVHTANEMGLLRSRFPDNIRIFVSIHSGEVIAGVVMFITETVAHSQYIATTSTGRSLGALDLLFYDLLHYFSGSKRYFSFGTSTEDDGKTINAGLIKQKEEFGGSGIIQDTYTLFL